MAVDKVADVRQVAIKAVCVYHVNFDLVTFNFSYPVAI